jgi:hypothetical protein
MLQENGEERRAEEKKWHPWRLRSKKNNFGKLQTLHPFFLGFNRRTNILGFLQTSKVIAP